MNISKKLPNFAKNQRVRKLIKPQKKCTESKECAEKSKNAQKMREKKCEKKYTSLEKKQKNAKKMRKTAKPNPPRLALVSHGRAKNF